jgi:FixJ family two-component response regulator
VKLLTIGLPFEYLVLFTDIRLPGPLSGWDIAERWRECHPKIPVIYATGFSDEEARPVPGSVLFQKPYNAAQLISMIRRLTP